MRKIEKKIIRFRFETAVRLRTIQLSFSIGKITLIFPFNNLSATTILDQYKMKNCHILCVNFHPITHKWPSSNRIKFIKIPALLCIENKCRLIQVQNAFTSEQLMHKPDHWHLNPRSVSTINFTL